jgi:SAM-dependent methyltransferase
MARGYGHAALAQRGALLAGLAEARARLLEPLLAALPPGTAQLCVADLGCADGINSLPVMAAVLEDLPETVRDLCVFHLDLPTADFNSLSSNLHGHPESYLHSHPAVRTRAMLVPGSFYDAPLPDASVDFAFATTAFHYASAKAAPVHGHIDPLYARQEQQVAWLELSRSDRERALLGVAQALRPGGKLWLVVPTCQREPGGSLGNHWYRALKSDLYEELEGLVRRGQVRRQALDDFALPIHDRELEEWLAYFKAHEHLWRLELSATRELENPYLESWREHRQASRFAQEYLASIRAWSERIVHTLVPGDAERHELFARLQARVKNDPERYARDNVSLYLGATRKA